MGMAGFGKTFVSFSSLQNVSFVLQIVLTFMIRHMKIFGHGSPRRVFFIFGANNYSKISVGSKYFSFLPLVRN